MSCSSAASPDLVAIFGPTATGKTSVATELARLLRSAGEDPVAVGCDALQLYRGMEALTGAPTVAQRAELEHRLVGIADPSEEWSAGRFAERAHAEIDRLREEGRRPLLVGGTGLYLRAAVSELDLRPTVEPEIRQAVEEELARLGPGSLHAALPAPERERIHPNDRRRIARATELLRAGISPPGESDRLWEERPRVPTRQFGLVRDLSELTELIDARVEEMASEGAPEEARRILDGEASRTARSAIGLEDFATGDLDAVRRAHRRYARRQLTWMRKMRDVHVIERTGIADDDVARQIFEVIRLGRGPSG